MERKLNTIKLLIATILLFCVLQSRAQAKWSERMAATVMHTWKDSFSLDDKPARWTYDMGVVLKGIEGVWLNTGEAGYFNYIQKQVDFFVEDNGDIKTYKPAEYNIDHINNGKQLLMLYRVTLMDKYLIAAKQLRSQLLTHPRTKEGSFWHKQVYPYQVWLDGLYMAQPFYAEYAMLAHEDSAFYDIADQFIKIEQHTRDAKTGLLYHGWDESRQQQWANKLTGTSPLFWSRAMGWYATALVDVLDYFPDPHPKRKELINILNRLVSAIEKQQDSKTGLWYDIMNYSGAGKEKNYFETSASCQFVYAVAKAARNHYIPAVKISIAKKGYAGIIERFVKTENGQTNLYGTVKVSGLGGNPYRDGSFNYYMSEPVIVNDPKGIGAFLLAANEMEMLPTLKTGDGKKIVMDNYFNRETKKDAFGHNIVFHYKWDDRDHSGFSFVSHLFNKYGAVTTLLDEAPSAANLQTTAVYFLVDPDCPKENKSPNYIEEPHINAIYNYVKNGGVLVMMANDSGNVEFTQFNKLAERFGMHWNENMRHDVIGNQFEQGAFPMPENHVIFKHTKKAYIKQVCTLTLQPPAVSVYTEKGEVMMSVAKVGKGTVFAVGDPWFYNEYVDGRKLPSEYQNYQAAEDLVIWLLKQTGSKQER